ncbi:MAG TPA: sigma-70 family RNA polymerase sigma factor, partial [Spirochaetia bacterium]|nr:sigma-70 family RNA polymerase sigma factor [Spirochaetia bacterium]
MAEKNVTGLVDHLFRHQAGKMVAALTGMFGAENLDTAEDAVQETLLLAMQLWPLRGVPDKPSAWLFRVARNKAIDTLRRGRRIIRVDFETGQVPIQHSPDAADADGDMLRMMFACCHPGIPQASQIAVILKSLCGFGTVEIARAFVVPEDTISKRLYRAKEEFRRGAVTLELPGAEEARGRTQAVLSSLYLLFNEGYNSASAEELIRRDLMEEAMRLCGLLLENPNTESPEAYALMALMCFHASRTDSRLSPEGEIILLPDQDRSRWDRSLIERGNALMNR